MEACKRILHQFLDGSDKRFVIPVYQRNYDWKTENCKRLLDDLVRVSKERSASHFFGGIVYFKPNVAGTDEYQIIDGQQRLTTVALFLLALKRLIEDGKIVVSDTALSSRINDYLVDKYAPETSKIKLKPINEDDDAFRRLFGFGGEITQSSKVTENYQYFLSEIVRMGLSADEFYNSFKKLEFVDISIESRDKPQLIFESINSTGVTLTEGDKIRNYVLMDLDSVIQERFFKKYWKPIESLVFRGRDKEAIHKLVFGQHWIICQRFSFYGECLHTESQSHIYGFQELCSICNYRYGERAAPDKVVFKCKGLQSNTESLCCR